MKRVLAVALVSALGCAHQPETKNEPPKTAEVTPPQSTPPATPPPPMAERSCSGDLDCGAKQLCIRNRCVDITADLAECGVVRIHFPFNSSEIDPNDKPLLERSARCLKADHELHITVEGNADERGTEEYNLTLGDQRATSVAKYLESLGASAVQLKTVSYGKENPLCTEHDEACWSKNRRANIQPSGLGKGKK